MESNTIKVNGQEITVFANGWIEKIHPQSKKTIVTNGGYDSYGYKTTSISGKSFKLHQLVAMAFLPEYSKGLKVNHINGTRDDNRLENIEMATTSDNARAHQKRRKGASSKYRGVSWNKKMKRWVVNIMTLNGPKYLGTFTDEIKAALAFNVAAIEDGRPSEGLNQI